MLARRPRIGIRALRRLVPGLPRNTALAYLRRWRRIRRRRRRRILQRLRWLAPGAVWAIDGTWLDAPVEGCGRRALVVVELESRKLLALRSVRGERSSETIRCLTDLIGRHGAPLVLKLDNGSAFVARRLARFCESHGITLLHSPVRRPSYNGTCEVSGRWAKARAQAAASLRGAGLTLTQDDLDQAVTLEGALPRIADEDRAAFRAAVERQLPAVALERGVALGNGLRDHDRRALARVAVQRALQECHILTIEGRGYRR